MCPKNDDVSKMEWFYNEPICKLQDVPGWVKRQKKIAKKLIKDVGIFTFKMLQQDCRISKGIKGIDNDGIENDRIEAEKKWLKAHPVKKPISEERREKMQAIGEKNKRLLALYRSKKAI